MKKLMMAVAIVCATAMAQAASVSWNSGSTKYMSEPGTVATAINGSICLIILSDNTGWSEGTWSAKTATELSTATLGSGKSAGKLTGTAFQFTYGSSNPIKDGDVLAVVFKDKAGNYSQLVYANDDAKPVTETLTVAGLADDQDLWSKTLQFGQGADKSSGIMSVPEPTSGLLLLLGMAGLALRRRRA